MMQLNKGISDFVPLLLLAGGVLLCLAGLLFTLYLGRRMEALGRQVREELRLGRDESGHAAAALREELTRGHREAFQIIAGNLASLEKLQQGIIQGVGLELRNLRQSNQSGVDSLRQVLDNRLQDIQTRTEQRLDSMRGMVEEKLHTTLEKRLGESFRLVSERLEAVQRGLGEMHSLAAGVGDLKKVLTNVKIRGTWGEVQLGALLEQILAPEQFAQNVRLRSESQEMVDYAVRLPGPSNESGEGVWLPIDAKFPQEDYLRLVDAEERGDMPLAQSARLALVNVVRGMARDIREKYIQPPATTDFAIMFLPIEGLYAEVLRQPGLLEELQRNFRMVVAGPTTLAAILNSLRMGFKTLAIERRASEVWTILAAVKAEFSRFGEVLERVRKQLDTASRTIESTGARTRAMERRLKDVEEMPVADARVLLRISGCEADKDGDGDG